ncbi:MAG: DNA-binding transcriptional regulator YhcF (GntR family) [Planctomycetota bacterium]
MSVNANTVKKSYRDLQKLGVVYGRSGRGVFVPARSRGVAPAVRLVETLGEFRKAASLALRAGYVETVLLDELRRLSMPEPG